MKKVIYMLALITFSAACKRDMKPKPPGGGEDVAEYALSVDTATSYTQRYVDFMRTNFNDSNPIKAYTVRAEDLLEAMGMNISNMEQATYPNVRVYIGMDASNKFRLLLTPVSGADINEGVIGNDVILNGSYTAGATTDATPLNDGDYVMDFTSPCPNSCPTNSPLYIKD